MNCLVGYFSSQLAPDITMSISPEDRTAGMYSWYPICFPLGRVLLSRKGDTLKATIWRECTDKAVWYEWQVAILREGRIVDQLEIHNCGGGSWKIGM